MAARVIALLNEKGGAGKSRLAQALVVELTRAGIDVLLVDMEQGPMGSEPWAKLRADQGWKPRVRVQRIARRDLHAVLDKAELLILDTPGVADRITKELAQASTLVVVPTGADLGDLQPTVDLMHQLANAGVDLERMLAVVVKASSAGMAREAHGYLTAAGYQVLEHATPFANTYVQAFSVGKAMTEAEAAGPRDEARRQVKEIADVLQRTLARDLERAEGLKREQGVQRGRKR